MAATKKSAAIAIQKDALAAKIQELWLTGHKNLTRVPDFVNCGSYQVAVAWKELVAKYFSEDAFLYPARATLTDMESISVEWKKRLEQLTGKAPLIEQDSQEAI
jgi:hypothetical protein